MSILTTPSGADVRFEDAGDHVRCVIDVHSPELHGKRAVLAVFRVVAVNDSRPVNEKQVLFTTTIESLAPQNAIRIARSELKVFSYRGSMIDITIGSELTIDDGIIWDTKFRDDDELGPWVKPAVSGDAKGIVEPKDAFDFVANLRAIPPQNQLITIVLCAVAAIIIGVNTLVGVHDQFAPEPMTWVYDHRDSDGDSESPLFKSLAGSGALGVAVWAAIRRQLRKYMTFDLAVVPSRICAADSIEVSTLVRGVPRVDLHDVRLRVVACNIEKGQYKRGSGTKERTVSFKQPVRAVILYDQSIPLIPAGAPVEQYLDQTICFEPMFRALYPPQASSTHGLSLHWEVQLIHDEFIDQELIGPIECFPWEEFLDA